MEKIDRFITDLKKYRDIPNVTNQYTSEWQYQEIATSNLRTYLINMEIEKPKVLLIGEAPGYKGCRVSGVPFTSERNLLNVYKTGLFFGQDNGFKVRDPENAQTESSATIVWNVLKEIGIFPLMWNAFPFHPYIEGDRETNRSPNRTELKIGREILSDIISIFDIKNIIAVGKVPERLLKAMKIQSHSIRHPSMGGKEQFTTEITSLLLHRDTTTRLD